MLQRAEARLQPGRPRRDPDALRRRCPGRRRAAGSRHAPRGPIRTAETSCCTRLTSCSSSSSAARRASRSTSCRSRPGRPPLVAFGLAVAGARPALRRRRGLRHPRHRLGRRHRPRRRARRRAAAPLRGRHDRRAARRWPRRPARHRSPPCRRAPATSSRSCWPRPTSSGPAARSATPSPPRRAEWVIVDPQRAEHPETRRCARRGRRSHRRTAGAAARPLALRIQVDDAGARPALPGRRPRTPQPRCPHWSPALPEGLPAVTNGARDGQRRWDPRSGRRPRRCHGRRYARHPQPVGNPCPTCSSVPAWPSVFAVLGEATTRRIGIPGHRGHARPGPPRPPISCSTAAPAETSCSR